MDRVIIPPDHFLVTFRRAVEEAFGDKLERVVLFGSRARGDARPDSDWDVAVFLKEGAGEWKTICTLSDLAGDIGWGNEEMYIQPVPLDALRTDRSLELREYIRDEGIEIPPA